MDRKKFLVKVLERLPEELKNDRVFKVIKERFLAVDERLLNAKDVILVLGDFAKDIQELQDFAGVVYSDISNFLFNFAVDFGNCTCTFYIAPSEEDGYIVTFTKSFKIKGIYKEAIVECLKKKEGSQLKIVESIFDEYYYFYDYECDINCYDRYGNLRTDIDTLALEDMVFSKEFDVPLEKAREYKNNFKNMRQYLNQSRINKGIMAMDNLFFNEKDGYLFSRPFDIINLADFINFDLSEEVLEDINFDDNLGVNTDFYAEFKERDIDGEKLSKVLVLIQELIGFDGEVVLSDNLVANLSSYADNEHMVSFATTGMIIKKVNDLYTLYYVNISDSRVITIGNPVSLEFVQALYKRNINNKTVPFLGEFFGFSREK